MQYSKPRQPRQPTPPMPRFPKTKHPFRPTKRDEQRDHSNTLPRQQGSIHHEHSLCGKTRNPRPNDEMISWSNLLRFRSNTMGNRPHPTFNLIIRYNSLYGNRFTMSPRPRRLPMQFKRNVGLLMGTRYSFPLLRFLPQRKNKTKRVHRDIIRQKRFPLLPPMYVHRNIFNGLARPSVRYATTLRPIGNVRHLMGNLLNRFYYRFLILTRYRRMDMRKLMVLRVGLLGATILRIHVPPF